MWYVLTSTNHPVNASRYFKRSIVFIFFLISVVACVQQDHQLYHPAYFDRVYEKLPKSSDTVNAYDLDYLDAAYATFPDAGAGDLYKKYRYKFLFFFEVLGDSKRGINYTDSIINLLSGVEDSPELVVAYANALFTKGDILVETQRYQEAVFNYLHGKKVMLDKIHDPCGLVEYNARMGRLLYKQGNYKEAIAFFQAGISDQSRCDTSSFFKFKASQEYLDDIGMCYNELGLYDSAYHYFSAALDYINRRSYLFSSESKYIAVAQAVVYDNQARLLQKMGRLSEAQELYQKSIAVTIQGHPHYTQLTQMALANLYLDDHQPAKALIILNKLKTSVDSFPAEEALTGYNSCMSKLYEQQGDLGSAANYRKKYLAVKDSLERRNAQTAGNDILSSFNIKEQQDVYQKLKDNDNNKTLYLLVISGLLMLAAAVLLLVKVNSRKTHWFAQHTEVLYQQIHEKNSTLQQLFIDLERKNTEHTTLMKTVSSDLKDTLSVIHHTTGQLSANAGENSHIQEELSLLQEASESSLHIIDEIHPFKVAHELGRKELVDLKLFLETSVNLLQPSALQKKQQIELSLRQAFALIDRQKLWRVINNVVMNAIKFSGENTVIKVNLEKKETSSLISVRDHGVGIPADIKDQIFKDKEVRGVTGTAGEESFGMGLSIAKKFIEENNGNIWFDSGVGGGTIFYIELAM